MPIMTVRMRHTKAHTRNRRSHHALSNPALTKDSKTGVVSMRHRVSPINGEYKGKKVLEISSKKKKALKEKPTEETQEKTEEKK